MESYKDTNHISRWFPDSLFSRKLKGALSSEESQVVDGKVEVETNSGCLPKKITIFRHKRGWEEEWITPKILC